MITFIFKYMKNMHLQSFIIIIIISCNSFLLVLWLPRCKWNLKIGEESKWLKSLHHTLPPLPKESPLHLTPSSQGVYATPYPLFPSIPHHTLPPLPKESTAYPTPSFVAKFPAAPARNYSTISFVCLKPALLKFSLVCIYFFFIFFCAPCRFKVWMSWLSTSSELLNYACEFTQQSNKLHLNSIDWHFIVCFNRCHRAWN